MIREILVIDERLRNCFSKLEAVLDLRFERSELERVFSDAIEDQVSQKRYVFFEARRIQVTGLVDDYEPEAIWLTITASRRLEVKCQGIVEEFASRC